MAVTYKYLGIGDIRVNGAKVFVWTKEIIALGEDQGTEMIRNKVYSFTLVGNELKIDGMEIVK
jgi:hypothetical protein